MKKVKRIIQLITGFHKIHHMYWSYGYKLPLLKIGYFNDKTHIYQFGFKKLKGCGIDYHDCTKTNKY